MITNRTEKNKALKALKDHLIAGLDTHFNIFYASEFKEKKDKIDGIFVAKKVPFLFFICSRKPENTMSNTLFLSVWAPNIDNSKIRAALERRGIIIGLGSACQKGGPSHIPCALGMPEGLKPGVIRISWSDYTKKSDIDKFVLEFNQVIAKKEYV
jgi:cysteine sulfinate desulfinase/cysteine desulfurase-like protein